MNGPEQDPIKHVIVLFLENRSFDQMLGCFKEKYPELEGVDPVAPHTNTDTSGRVFTQRPTTIRQMPSDKAHQWDPHHEVEHVHMQIEGDPDHPAPMGGFVFNFSKQYPGSTNEARQYVMDYYPRGFLPGMHSLAEDFTICDHWFSSLPGPTWPNRFFALSGTAQGRTSMPGDGTHHLDIPGFFQQSQETIFDRLNEKGIHWKSYFHDVPQSWVMRRPRLPQSAARYFYIREFFIDARGLAEDFPQFCYIEPDFMGVLQNDDHPPHDIMKGEKLIVDVYNALRSNPALWHSSLLVVFFDEHGGFYDHVYPPKAVRPDHHAEEYGFEQLGVRVPALLVSPHVGRRVEQTQFDHTSLLKYLVEKWGLNPLGARTAAANSIAVALRDERRDDADTISYVVMTADQLTPPDPDAEDEAFGISGHHKALRKFTTYLKVKLWVDPIAAADEKLPRLYSLISRNVQAVMFALLWTWRQMLGKAWRPDISFTQPDKVRPESALERDDVANFLMRRKRNAIAGTAKLLREGRVIRGQALRALASMTNRPFHRYERLQNRHDYADAWLARHGHAQPTGAQDAPPPGTQPHE
jgi:phospholipase C